MGLFDTVKLKANALAADAERAGKVTAAQARTVVLQNDIRKAERELGHSAFSLIESGEIAHPDLEAAAARLREARQALKDKEAEIAGLRGARGGRRRGCARAGSAAATGAGSGRRERRGAARRERAEKKPPPGSRRPSRAPPRSAARRSPLPRRSRRPEEARRPPKPAAEPAAPGA